MVGSAGDSKLDSHQDRLDDDSRAVKERVNVERIVEASVENCIRSEGLGITQEGEVCFTLGDALVGRNVVAIKMGPCCGNRDQAASCCSKGRKMLPQRPHMNELSQRRNRWGRTWWLYHPREAKTSRARPE